MKLATTHVDIAEMSSNFETVGGFKMKASATSFRVLSNGLYSNKIRAIIRELSCNAVDSHKAANNPQPFDVHLPNSFENWFSVRDYGTGLTKHQVKTIYTTYFESTKQSDNTMIGGLGLGSKSPFSYTNTFAITTYKDGIKNICSAFINEHGVPDLVFMAETTTDEPNGVEVKIAVSDPQDYIKFTKEAEQVYRHFELTPNVTGVSNFKIDYQDYRERNVIPNVHIIGGNKPVAVMGNIEYPLSNMPTHNLSSKITHLLACGLELHFDIGELDIQPSREGLSYDAKTINKIVERLTELDGQIKTIVKNKINQYDNVWKQNEVIENLKYTSLYAASAREYTSTSTNPLIKFGEIVLNHEEFAKKYNCDIVVFNSHHRKVPPSKLICGNNKHIIHQHKISATAKYTYFVYNDSPVCNIAKVKKTIFEEQKNKSGLIKRESTVVLLTRHDNSMPINIDQLVVDMHKPPNVINIQKEFPEFNKKVSTKADIQPICAMSVSVTNRSYFFDRKKVSGDLLEQTGVDKHYYLPTQIRASGSYWKASTMADTGSIVDVADMLVAVKKCDLVHFDTVYALNAAQVEKIKDNRQWVNFANVVNTALENMSDSDIYDGAVVYYCENGNTDLIRIIDMFKRRNLVEKIVDKNNIILQLQADVEQAKVTHRNAQLTSILSDLGAFSGSEKVIEKMNMVVRELTEKYNIKERYPMLTYLDRYSYHSSDFYDNVINYINMVDRDSTVTV